MSTSNKRTAADTQYRSIVENLIVGDPYFDDGPDIVTTRNHPAYRVLTASAYFDHVPLVTWRKTAWKKALKEMEWFLSGEPHCPAELRDWWSGQLSPNGAYMCGYGQQLRGLPGNWHDQITHLVDGLRNHPFGRRHIITTWNPRDMAQITEINGNPATPTTCHMSFMQFFVRKGKLYAKDYQRSGDIMLGVPHNWIQHWALMLWLAHKANLQVGGLEWIGGDIHLYDDPSHVQPAQKIIEADYDSCRFKPNMEYRPTSDEFKADDFRLHVVEEFEPIWTERPRLF